MTRKGYKGEYTWITWWAWQVEKFHRKRGVSRIPLVPFAYT